jgi:hypothetical protein
MLKTYDDIKRQDRENEQIRERARVYSAILAERDSAASLVKQIEAAVSTDDPSAVAATRILEVVDSIDIKYTTKGSALGVPGGVEIRWLLRTMAGEVLTATNRVRAALESKLPAARERLREAEANLASFEKKYDSSKRGAA